MYKGVSIWNYGQAPTYACARAFADAGFTAISWIGGGFGGMGQAEGGELAAFIRDADLYLTVHHKLPNPDDAAECTLFKTHMDNIAAWQSRHGLLRGLTFDTWYDRASLMPHLSYALERLRGMGAFLACEDFPRTRADYDAHIAPILNPRDNFGILIDIGHLNMHLHKYGDPSPDGFIASFAALPLPVREVHLHDNGGEKDDHTYIGGGNLPVGAVAKGLKDVGFDGAVTVEIIQQKNWSLDDGVRYADATFGAFRRAFDVV